MNRNNYLWIAVLLALFAYLQIYHKYHFFYVEQNQLFQNTWSEVKEILLQPAGLASLIAGFLMQFFIYPFAGAIITACILTLVGWFSCSLLRKISSDSYLDLLSLLPVCTLLFMHFDYVYFVSGSIALIIALGAANLTYRINNFCFRFCVELLTIILLFFLAGSVYVLYTMAIIIIELLFGKSKSRFLTLSFGIIVAIIGWLSVKYSVIINYKLTFLPDLYYHWMSKPGFVIYFSWISVVLLIILAKFIKTKHWLSFVIQAVTVILILWIGIPKYDFRNSYETKKFDWYSRNDQWDKILDESKGKITNFLKLNYINMALANRGELANRLFSFDQRDSRGLMAEWNKTTGISLIMSDISFVMNYVALSQEMAFEAYVGSIGNGNPRILKRLIQTNLINGAYPVAEKYIKILENTLAYRDWATQQRRFLYNDAAIEADPQLGNKRKSLSSKNSLSMIDGIETELEKIAESNPNAHSAIEYLGCSYLLAKDLKGFKSVLDKFYGTPVLSPLPVSFQEALFVLFEPEPEKIADYEISNDIATRYNNFRQTVLANKNNRNALSGIMLRQYGNTYWYFFMFK